MDINNTSFKIGNSKGEEWNAFNAFVRLQGHTEGVLMRNTECKHSFVNHTPHCSKINETLLITVAKIEKLWHF